MWNDKEQDDNMKPNGPPLHTPPPTLHTPPTGINQQIRGIVSMNVNQDMGKQARAKEAAETADRMMQDAAIQACTKESTDTLKRLEDATTQIRKRRSEHELKKLQDEVNSIASKSGEPGHFNNMEEVHQANNKDESIMQDRTREDRRVQSEITHYPLPHGDSGTQMNRLTGSAGSLDNRPDPKSDNSLIEQLEQMHKMLAHINEQSLVNHESLRDRTDIVLGCEPKPDNPKDESLDRDAGIIYRCNEAIKNIQNTQRLIADQINRI